MARKKKPQFHRFMVPLLEALRELGGSGQAGEVADMVIERMGISEQEQEETISSGQSRIRNQIGWARFYLAKAGYIGQSRRGVWNLTEKGQNADLSALDTKNLHKVVRDVLAEEKLSSGATGEDFGHENDDTVSPEAESVMPDYKEELLNSLRELPPDGFERICQRLLRESGFEQVAVTGKSGDGGIDGIGILQVNPFVSFKVLFQCKRYQGTVSASQVRDFRGAMQGRADKGIIMTTGGFTTDAKKEARRDGVPPIELVDGDKLVQMFELLELGLKPVKTFEVDPAFFEEFK